MLDWNAFKMAYATQVFVGTGVHGFGILSDASDIMSKRSSTRPKHPDLNQLAKAIVGETTGESPPPIVAALPPDGKNPAAVALGRLGGRVWRPLRNARNRRCELALVHGAIRFAPDPATPTRRSLLHHPRVSSGIASPSSTILTGRPAKLGIEACL